MWHGLLMASPGRWSLTSAMSLAPDRKTILHAASCADTCDDMMTHLLKASTTEMDHGQVGSWKKALAYISANARLVFSVRETLCLQHTQRNRDLVRHLMDSVQQRIRVLVTQTYIRYDRSARFPLV